VVLLVARTRDKANADRLMKVIQKVGSTHAKKTKEKDKTFIVKFTVPSGIELFLRRRKKRGRKSLNRILQDLGSSRRILGLMLDHSPEGIALRSKVVAVARKEIPDFPEWHT
jgi:hypothetical protein